MSRLGFKSKVFHDELCLGELDVIPVKDQNFQFPNNEIRIHHISQKSERCPPHSILQTISPFSVCCKLETSSPVDQPHLINLHASCHYEMKTAVILVGDEEIHMVSMLAKHTKYPCFWCYVVPCGLYNSSLGMLNMRCLAIVFDLDETLIVANTMKSFEDRIELLRSWIAREADPLRSNGMHAEMKRYMDDRLLLKQYADNDSVVDNGKVFKVQLEEVPPLLDNQERTVRPVIRLHEKNIVLTRINPEIRDTSVLVRLRPAWEDLRCYLTARGRKRFEVYVCTMAERDYALEMWRLLDPESHLIGLKQLRYRVVCVKSGSRKSLNNVFPDGICHSKMAMVIDDRLKVWEDRDQPRVHVVPAFTPYYAPQAETANAVPVLCVARNVACNVRGCFFKEFDENLLRRICETFYEDDVVNLPPAPDVSNYLMSEDAGFVPNGNPPINEGMNGVEVERRFNLSDDRHVLDSAAHTTSNNAELRSETSHPPVPILVNPSSLGPLLPSQRPGLLGPPVRRDGFSDRDHDLKRGILSMKHGLDLRNHSSGDPPLLSRIPAQLSVLPVPTQGGWLAEDDISRQTKNRPFGLVQESDMLKPDRQRAHQNSSSCTTPGPSPTPAGLLSHNTSEVKTEEVHNEHNLQKQNLPLASQPADVGLSPNQSSSINRDLQTDIGKTNLIPSPLSIGVLQEIARRCSSKVEFKSVVSTSKDLQFSVEVLFTGEKIGVGMGKTRKDAQQQAAENALHNLADKYVAYVAPRSGAVDTDFNKLSIATDNGFLWDVVKPGSTELPREDELPKESNSEGAEIEPGTTSSAVNLQVQKRANSPRLLQSVPTKRSKEELMQG
ncbi:hypothetical protein UlMin_000501 [Ulmus minor]